MKLAPSILSFDFSTMAESVRQLADAGADWVHFDVMDGQFVPPITFGDAMVRDLRPHVDLPFEAHLMTETPEAHFEAFARAGCRRIIFHAEASAHIHRLAGRLREMGLESGLAINPGTPAEAVIPNLAVLDLVLVMTVNPGWGGQSFLSETLDKIQQIRAIDSRIELEVDGGIDPETLPMVAEAGATIAVVGSFLTRTPTIADGIRQLRDRCSAS